MKSNLEKQKSNLEVFMNSEKPFLTKTLQEGLFLYNLYKL